MNEPAARGLMRHLVEHGSDGVVIAGTTGESATLDDEEKLQLFEAAVDELGGRATVVAGTGSNDTAHSVRLTREAAARGVDAVLVVTPYYNRPNERGLRAHFTACAKAAGDVPMLLYNIPGRSVINLEPDLLIELSKIDNIVGVKQANADMDAARRIVEESELALLAGDDNLLRPFAEIGGAGGITVSSHLAGERMKEVFEAAEHRRHRARAVPRRRAGGPLPHALHRAAARNGQGSAGRARLRAWAACACPSSRLTRRSWRSCAGCLTHCGRP